MNYRTRQVEHLLRFLIPSDASVLEVKEDEFRSLKLEVSGAPFDYIYLSGKLEYLHDVEGTLRDCYRLLKEEDGRLVLISYNYLWYPVIRIAEILGIRKKHPVQNWLTMHDIETFLHLADFEVISSGKRILCPVYVPIISVLLNRIIGRLPFLWRLCLMNYVVARPLLHARKDRSVTIVVPARNERGNIEKIVQRTPLFPNGEEIIFVEGHSKDGTWEEIERVMERYKTNRVIRMVRQDGIGKGDAVRKGFSIAEGELLMILDADMTVAPEDLTKFYRAFVEGKGEFINGSRLVYPLEKEAMRFLNNLGNKFFALSFSWLLGQRFKDTLCGTKVLSKSAYERIAANRHYFGDFDPFGDFDLLFGAAKLNLKIAELPIRYYARRYGETQIQRFRHGWMLLTMCVFAARKFKFQA